MAWSKKIKQFLKTFDLFAQPVTFRFGDEPVYETMTGGVCSIIMIIVFIAIFTGTAVNTLNKVYISTTTVYSEDIDPVFYKTGTDTFMFALNIQGFDMTQGERWFDVYMQYRSYDNVNNVRNKTYITLKPCQKEVWTQIDEKLADIYDRLGFDTWLCPSNGTIMQLQGKFTSQNFKFYKFAVTQCDPALDLNRPCVINSRIETHLNYQQAFNFNFYFVNMIINSGSKQYLSYYMDDFNYFPFSLKSGTNANLFISTFNIQTDQSIYPMDSLHNDTGGIILNTAKSHNYEVRQNQYMKFYLRKSSLRINITRQFRKVDDTLSYIGGLFSAILGVLILMTLFNQTSFQLEIAKSLYYYEKNEPISIAGFNFFIYLGYLIFLLFDKFGVILPWNRMKVYHRSLQEVRKQMDIRLIFKKLEYEQRVISKIVDEHKAMTIHLQQPLTLSQAEEIRKDYRFYEKLSELYLCFPNLSSNPSNQDPIKKQQTSFNNFMINNDFTEPSPLKKQIRTTYGKSQNSVYPQNYETDQDLSNNVTSNNKVNQPSKQYVQKRLQWKQRVSKMKQNIDLLKMQASNGDTTSQKILAKFDPEIMNYFIDESSLQHISNVDLMYSHFINNLNKIVNQIAMKRKKRQIAKLRLTNSQKNSPLRRRRNLKRLKSLKRPESNEIILNNLQSNFLILIINQKHIIIYSHYPIIGIFRIFLRVQLTSSAFTPCSSKIVATLIYQFLITLKTFHRILSYYSQVYYAILNIIFQVE